MSSDRTPLLTLGNALTIRDGECWGVVGGNGSGKSFFARALAGQSVVQGLERKSSLDKVICVSFEDEQKLLEREIYEDDSEYMDRTDHGRTTRELVAELASDTADLDAISSSMQLEYFLDTGFRLLSTGERRRMMIARALAQSPDMLVLDEPYDGLDISFKKHLEELIASLSESMPLVLIVNRLSQLGEAITHIACLENRGIVIAGSREKIEASPLWRQLQAMHVEVPTLPGAPPDHVAFSSDSQKPIIEMRDVKVGYHEKPIIRGLDWNVMPGEHWKVSGPNGCGKSTLVNLVSGDHPQCYANDIRLFGKRRGQGESIWDIKRHMGLMSTALHQQYRVTVTVETVLLSGFFDSIGVYKKPKPYQYELAAEWLDFLHMTSLKNEIFQRLSFGQQRMLLIARALVKRPHLLILDEPCQGLDPMNRALVIRLVERICERGLAQLLYISHDPEDHIACLTHELVFSPSLEQQNQEMPPYQISQTNL
ncbi:MAG: molybdate ABC transporter ATP-binding protein ModF [Akkermansiaceae bacterium]